MRSISKFFRVLSVIAFAIFIALFLGATSKAANVPLVTSLDITYEIGIDSTINVQETATFEKGTTGEYVRRIPKYFRSQDEKKTTVYGVKNVGLVDNSKILKIKTKEDNDVVQIAVDLSNLTAEENNVTLSYKIERVLNEVGRKDDANLRNNIELLGNILILSDDAVEPTYKSIQARIVSRYAEIGTIECIAGDIKSGQRMCLSEYQENNAKVSSTYFLGAGKGLAVSLKIMKGGEIVPVGKTRNFIARIGDYLRVNWMQIVFWIAVLLLIVYFFNKVFYIKVKKE